MGKTGYNFNITSGSYLKFVFYRGFVMFTYFKYNSRLAAAALVIMLAMSAGSLFASIDTGKIISESPPSADKIISEHSITTLAAMALRNNNSKKACGKSGTSVENLGYGKPKILKPILISYYTASLGKYKNGHKILSSRSGQSVHTQKVMVDIAPIIEKYAEKYKVDPYLVRAIIKTESGFRPYAVSFCGAAGLMQLMPGTAGALGVRNIFDPEQNIEAGTKYIKELLTRMKDFTLAIAAYNAGPYNVLKYGGIPPFAETRNFVNKVLNYYKEK